MNPRQVKEEVRELLLSQEPHQDNGDEVVIRCPVCGDSIKSDTSTHFHIKTDLDDDSMPLVYHCFRCDAAGVLNSDILKDIGIYNLSLNSSIKAYNKQALKSLEKRGYTKYADKVNINLPYPQNLDLAEKKRQYISKRLGLSLSLEELVALKVCFNFADFLRANEINKLNVSKEILSKLHHNYVGFISTNNDFIQFRDIIGKEQKFRYYNYDVFKTLDKSRNFYSIPNKIDLMTTDDIHIVLAEGIFDILGVFYHVYDCKTENMIYSAVCGCGFASVIKYYLRKGLTGKNIHFTIFSDTDKAPEFYSYIYEETKDWVGSITLCYNIKNKDCGVPKSLIEIVDKKIPKAKGKRKR